MNTNESMRILKREIAASSGEIMAALGHHPHNLTCGTYSRWHLVCPACGCVGTASEEYWSVPPGAQECYKCGAMCSVIDIKEGTEE